MMRFQAPWWKIMWRLNVGHQKRLRTSLVTIREFSDDVIAQRRKLSEGAVLTANLSVNYRRPVFAESTYLVELRVDRLEKRKKCYLTATISDQKGRVCVEATSLYIVAKVPPPSKD